MSTFMKYILLILILMPQSGRSATWKKIIGGVPAQVCPENYILVPALAGYTTIDFCVAKYEMKSDGAEMPESVAAGTPWVWISKDYARWRCKLLGAGFDMISNDQWQTIARNIAGTASNWSSGVVASGELNAGHSDSTPNNSLAASTDDLNGNCLSTGQTCTSSTWNSQRRTHTLSNGNVIWDFAGNVSEWVTNDSTAAVGADGYISTQNDGLIRQIRYGAASGTICASPGVSPYCGMGYGVFNSNQGAVFRSGDWDSGIYAGVFTTSLNTAPSTATGFKGFRCVFIP